MDKKDFILSISRLETIKSVTGIEYRIILANDSIISGLRMSTGKSFKISTEKLFIAYQDLAAGRIYLTTSALKSYVDRAQSPSLAILTEILSNKK